MRRASVAGATLLIVVLAVAAGVATVVLRQKKDVQAPPAFEPSEAAEIVQVHETKWQATADLVGTVFAKRSITVRNELAGVVRFIGFGSGEAVEEGRVLLRLDDSTERADLDAVKAAVRVAEANVAQADTQIGLAEVELGRLAGVQSRAVAEVELDRARAKLESVRAERGRWAAEVDQAKARVAQMEARIAKLTIRAPFGARAGLRTVYEGQYLAEGTDVVALQELTDDVYLDFAVPQEYAPRVKPGMTVMATADLLGPNPVKITVDAVDATVNYDTRNLRVRAVVGNADGKLVPGMSVQVRVPIEEPKTLLTVPSTAVRRAPYGNSVFVVSTDEGTMRAHQTFVTLGEAVGDEVIVLKGLNAGDRVAAAGSFKLRDKVKITDGPPGGSEAADKSKHGS